ADAATILDYHLPDRPVVILDPGAVQLALEQFEQQAEEFRDTSELSGELPRGLPRPYHAPVLLPRALADRPVLWLGTTSEPNRCSAAASDLGFTTGVPIVAGRLDTLPALLEPYRAEGYTIGILTEQPDRIRQRLHEWLRTSPSEVSDVEVIVARGRLPGGWAHREAKVLILTDRELYGLSRLPSPRRRGHRPVATDLLSKLTPGVYVVHVDHGIARYGGLVSLVINGVHREYLLLEYADNDRLYLPVDQLDRITLYEAFDVEPKLTRLGSPEWARVKRRVHEAVRELAFELLQLYAAREATSGIAFGPDTAWDRELEESFPYEETPDQWRAIQEVKADMERPRPMDRLLCGDVGFGKTEVALRAAFKAVNNGYQVAILVPTTVLALQHYNT
ncbi:MAG: CarD family transcriptional regulator, partial [Thermomicrobium sp.]